MKDLFYLITWLGTFGLTVLPFIPAFDKSKTWLKIVVALIILAVTAGATLWREKVTDREEDAKDSVNQQQLAERDRLSKFELKQRDSVNKEELIALADLFSQKLIEQGQQIDKAVPFISPFNIKTVKGGLRISYTVYKPIERLKLTILPNVFDDTFDPSFGTGVINLPIRIGKNTIVIPPEKIPFGKWATFQISSVNPHLNSVVFDHFNFTTSSSGQILITADNDFITADNDQILISDSVAVETIKH
jgi:hypothetical protein